MLHMKKQKLFSAKLTPWLCAGAISMLLCGCSSIFAVSEEEAFAQERQFLAEYQANKALYQDAKAEAWVQPVNKKEQCRIYLGYDKSNQEKALNTEYYWDGACKEGFAYGIGREFVRSDDAVTEDLAEYKAPGQEPTYYYHKDKLTGFTATGISNSQKTAIQGFTYGENGSDFKYMQVASVVDREQYINYLIYQDPIAGIVRKGKEYPNFAFVFEFNQLNNQGGAYLLNKKINEPAPYGFFITSNTGSYRGVRKASFTAQPEAVILPESYWAEFVRVLTEIEKQLNDATLTRSVNRADMIKKEYIAQKCHTKAAAPFASWPDYFDICHEDKFLAEVAKKVSAKIEERNAQMAALAQQRQQQALIQAQINAAQAQRRAAEAQQAVAALEQFNAGLQQTNNLNQNLFNMVNQNNMQMMNTTVPNLVGNPNRGKIRQCFVQSTGWVNCYN